MKQMFEELEQFYHDVNRAAKRLETVHRDILQCSTGCTACCVDDITVFMIEADNIRSHYARLLREQPPHPAGACAFLDESGACRIYDQRPYVCRSQGLPLRWIEENVEYRDICPLNDRGEAIENLPSAQSWTIGPFEGRLAALQERYYDGKMRRIALRALLTL